MPVPPPLLVPDLSDDVSIRPSTRCACGMRTVNRLAARMVECMTAPGFCPDGGGLCLQVGGTDRRSWVCRYMLHGSLRSPGIDPLEARRKHKADAKRLADRSMTFRQCAETYIKADRPSWRNVMAQIVYLFGTWPPVSPSR